MIADHDAKQRFDTISEMAADIADLKQKLETLGADYNKTLARAIKAEAQVHVLEQQLTHPKKEVFTLSLVITNPEDRIKADAELAKKINDGWERFDSAYIGNSGERTIHYITLVRAVPVPAEPIQPAATETVVVAATKPAPDLNPDSLPVTRKVVVASAILEPGEMPAIVESEANAAIEVDPPMTRDEEVKLVAEKAYNDALARNPLPARRPLSSFKSVQGSAP